MMAPLHHLRMCLKDWHASYHDLLDHCHLTELAASRNYLSLSHFCTKLSRVTVSSLKLPLTGTQTPIHTKGVNLSCYMLL